MRPKSVDWETTENIFIEGDNLEVLKLLQKAYFGKIKMIYIDPPYNTGKEFIYPDKYSETSGYISRIYGPEGQRTVVSFRQTQTPLVGIIRAGLT